MRGYSLLEVLVAMGLGSLVTAVMLVTLSGGLNVAAHLRGEQEALFRAELLAARLGPDLRETDLNLAKRFEKGFAFPVALDDAGHFSTQADGSPQWTGMLLYFWSDRQLFSRRLDLKATESQWTGAFNDRTRAQRVAAEVGNIGFRVIAADRLDAITGQSKTVPLLVEVSADLEYCDRRGRRVRRPWSRQFFARNSLSVLRHPVLPLPDDPPAPALNLPPFKEPGTWP